MSVLLRPCRLILLDARFVSRTRRLPCGCLEWMGAKSIGGGRTGTYYGSFNACEFGGTVRAHVWVAWRAGIIPSLRVPEGQHLDHECDNTLCVEEKCLRLLPFLENISKMWERRRQIDEERETM